MIDPIIIEPSTRRSDNDCAICCLKMLLGVDYSAITAAIPKRAKPSKNGLTVRQMRAVAKRLGFDLRSRSTPPEDDEIGILDLEKDHDPDGHVAMFARGLVYDSTLGLLYTDIGAYSLITGWTVIGFLWRES